MLRLLDDDISSCSDAKLELAPVMKEDPPVIGMQLKLKVVDSNLTLDKAQPLKKKVNAAISQKATDHVYRLTPSCRSETWQDPSSRTSPCPSSLLEFFCPSSSALCSVQSFGCIRTQNSLFCFVTEFLQPSSQF